MESILRIRERERGETVGDSWSSFILLSSILKREPNLNPLKLKADVLRALTKEAQDAAASNTARSPRRSHRMVPKGGSNRVGCTRVQSQ